MNMINIKNEYKDKKSNIFDKQNYINMMYEYHKNLFLYSEFIKDTNISKIIIEDNTLVMITRDYNIKLICNNYDKRAIPIEILNFNNYEKEELDMIIKILEIVNPKFILDIGANIGYISLILGKYFKNASIYSFEPILSTFDILKKNIEINKLSNIFINNCGISDENKLVTFYYYPEGTVNTSMKNLSQKKDVIEIKSYVKKLDDIVENLNMKIDFLKCDIEGAELFAFKGGVNSLIKYKPIIYTELLRKWAEKFNYFCNDIIDLLNGIGYLCFIVKDKFLCPIKEIDDNTNETNFFFLHSEKHLEIIQSLLYKFK